MPTNPRNRRSEKTPRSPRPAHVHSSDHRHLDARPAPAPAAAELRALAVRRSLDAMPAAYYAPND